MNTNDKTPMHGESAPGSTSGMGGAGQGMSGRGGSEDFAASARRRVGEIGQQARDAGSKLKDAAEDAMAEGKSRLETVMAKATDARDAVVSGAGASMAAVRDAAVEKAEVARESLSEVGDRLAATLERAASDDDGEGGVKTRVLGSVAQGLHQASEALRQRSVADLTSDVKEMARRHPGAFIAAAALAGFAAARFVRSSSRRVAQHDDHGQGPRV